MAVVLPTTVTGWLKTESAAARVWAVADDIVLSKSSVSISLYIIT